MAEQLTGLAFLKKNEITNKMCDMERPFAFISYSHDEHDTQIVRNVFNMLYSKGYNLWIDTANMPHDENNWSDCAIEALQNENCIFAFFFRSESSIIKETIAKELQIIKFLEHIACIVVVDIWHDEETTANSYYAKLLNNKRPEFKVCDTICDIVKRDSPAIRLAADTENNVILLANAMEEELRKRKVYPIRREEKQTGGGDGGKPEPGPTGRGGGGKPGPEPDSETISLPDFLKEYNNKNFTSKTFSQVRLVGEGKYAAYSTPFFDSVYPVVWSFVMKLLEERGEAYLHFVNEKNSGQKNPPFITAEEYQKQKTTVRYRKLELPGLEGYFMCRNYGQYDWVNHVLRKRILELDMPLDAFSFAYREKPQGPDETTEEETAGPDETTEKETGETDTTENPDRSKGGITGPKGLDGKSGTQRKRAPKEDSYSITLCGERCVDLSLKDMMLTVFKKMLDRHPDKLDLLLEDLPCLREGIEIRRDTRPATFRTGETIELNGRSISIGASLGREQVLSYIRRLMQICGESKENLVIDGYNY